MQLKPSLWYDLNSTMGLIHEVIVWWQRDSVILQNLEFLLQETHDMQYLHKYMYKTVTGYSYVYDITYMQMNPMYFLC